MRGEKQRVYEFAVFTLFESSLSWYGFDSVVPLSTPNPPPPVISMQFIPLKTRMPS